MKSAFATPTACHSFLCRQCKVNIKALWPCLPEATLLRLRYTASKHRKSSPTPKLRVDINKYVMRVLLLGATGNLGKRCVPALLAHEHVLTIYVRNPSKFKSVMSPEIIQRLESIVVGDATDTATIAKTIRDHDIEGIVNVAGNQVLPWKEFLLPKIAKAVADAAIAVGNERGVPLRVW